MGTKDKTSRELKQISYSQEQVIDHKVANSVLGQTSIFFIALAGSYCCVEWLV